VLSVFRGGDLQQKLEATGTSQTVTVANADQDYTFAVAAVNKVGQGESSATSPPKRAAGKPGTVSGVKLAAHNIGGDGGQLQASFTPVADSRSATAGRRPPGSLARSPAAASPRRFPASPTVYPHR
jgi:large repetitive protein